jgi:hypothetical protein
MSVWHTVSLTRRWPAGCSRIAAFCFTHSARSFSPASFEATKPRSGGTTFAFAVRASEVSERDFVSNAVADCLIVAFVLSS